jgi:YbbR domain-containing protein
MLVRFFRWLSRNLGNLILAFFMALVVWVAAIIAADPTQEGVYPSPIPLEVIGQDPSMLQLEDIPTTVQITINAPQSIWNQLTEEPDLIRAWIDLSGLGQGEHEVEVKTQVQITPAQVVSVDPAELLVFLEPSKTSEFEVELTVTGDPALGYRAGVASIDPPEVIVSGSQSLVNQVAQVATSLDINGANATIRRDVPVQALDATGNPVRGVDITPQNVRVTQTVNLLGGYRNVVVRVLTTGEPADGYWLSNISVSPPNVTVFSTNPQLVNQLPGYVETNPIDLTGLTDDVDIRASLNLPEGVTLVGEESVLVRLSIAAQESTLPITLPIEAIGLLPEMEASFSPESVDLLLAGPLPILNNLKPAEVRVVANLSGMEPGLYQVIPVVDLLPSQVRVIYIQPETVSATIIIPPTATPTPTGGTPTETLPEGTPTPDLTLTPSPAP